MPKISVIVPVYKVEQYLNRCIDSILNQTYTDLEVILVDDGSPDNCPALCDQAALCDPRVVVIHKENGGVSSARNAGLNVATGEYIAFVDSDDYISSNMCEVLLEAVERTNADIAECDLQFGVWENEDTGEECVYSGTEAIGKVLLEPRFKLGLAVNVCNKLYRSELFKEIKFSEQVSYGEDREIVLRLFYAAKCVLKRNVTLYMYSQEGESIMRSPLTLKKVRSELYVNQLNAEFLKDKDELRPMYDLIRVRRCDLLFHYYYECYQRRENEAFGTAAESIKNEINEYVPKLREKLNLWLLLKYGLFRVCPPLWRMLIKRKRSRTA